MWDITPAVSMAIRDSGGLQVRSRGGVGRYLNLPLPIVSLEVEAFGYSPERKGS